MANKEKKDYEKPELTQLGDDRGELSEKDLNKVSGGVVVEGNCTTGNGDSLGCQTGNSAGGNICGVGSGVHA